MATADLQAPAFTDETVPARPWKPCFGRTALYALVAAPRTRSALSAASRLAPASTTVAIARGSSPSRSVRSLSAPRFRFRSGGWRYTFRFQQEGHQLSPAPQDARRYLSDRMVHVTPHPRGDARRQPRPAWRQGAIVEADETYYGEGPIRQAPHPVSAVRLASVRSLAWSSVAATSAPSTWVTPTEKVESMSARTSIARPR